MSDPTVRMVQPIKSRQTVQDGVYRALREALVRGRFDPNHTLTIPALAEAFETSHMPVREALRRLVAENALEMSPNGSARVPGISRARMDDIFRTRIVLEGYATELAVPRLSARDRRAIEQARIQHETSGVEDGVYEMLDRNQEFHFQIYAGSGSEVMPQLIEALWLRLGPYMRALSHHIEPLLGQADFANGAQYHRRIVAALDAGDAAAARSAVEDDIRATQALLHTLVPADQDAESESVIEEA
ncbi:GntR family transcriptional regulator [Fodinicurvata sp. EGI_FJ10296]|uniref:GntR family transcriptional regulator n=1 Tax=Fodinicurvata sp. EGI_FJ10296 TaxID=3231908 RepID=UPI003451D4F4